MELDAFRSRLGVGQGRIRPRSAVAPEGGYVFVLGDEEPGRFFDLAPGDYAQVAQDVDVTDVDLVRAHLRLRVPASLAAGLAWEVSLLVDGSKLARATCAPGRVREIADLAANVSKLRGIHALAIRLELVNG